jgi:hypothetical protein
MPPSENLFIRLARLARGAPDDPLPGDLPPVLATRVLARLRADKPQPASPWERLSIRSVPLAAGAAAVCLYFGGRATHVPEPDEQWLAASIVQNQLEP